MDVLPVCAWSPKKPDEAVEAPWKVGLQTVVSCHVGGGNLNSVSLEEQPVRLAAETCLHSVQKIIRSEITTLTSSPEIITLNPNTKILFTRYAHHYCFFFKNKYSRALPYKLR